MEEFASEGRLEKERNQGRKISVDEDDYQTIVIRIEQDRLRIEEKGREGAGEKMEDRERHDENEIRRRRKGTDKKNNKIRKAGERSEN